jgi:hypothetical protein
VVARTDDTFMVDKEFVEPNNQTGYWTKFNKISHLFNKISHLYDNQTDGTSCESKRHGLKTSTRIRTWDTGVYEQNGQDIKYDGTYSVTVLKDSNTFDIDKTFLSNHRFVKAKQDLYSMKLTFVFSVWIGRCQSPEFRESAADIIRRKNPAHIICKLLWLDHEKF